MRRSLPVLLLAAFGFVAQPADATIVAGGNGTQNTTGSGAGTGWNYTGSVFYAGGEFNASAVYLGNYGGSYYVLTAYHISGTDNSQPTRGAGLGTFTIGTNNYSFSGAPVRISSMDLGNADLVVVKITPNDLAAQTYLDGLSNLSLSTSSPSLNTSVTMIGSGRNRATSQTTYDEHGKCRLRKYPRRYHGFRRGQRRSPGGHRRLGWRRLPERRHALGHHALHGHFQRPTD